MAVDTLPIKQFHGGITDDAVGSRPSQYLIGDNCLIDDSQKLISRPGSDLFDTVNAQLPTGNQRVGTLINFSNDTGLIAQSARRMFIYNAGWTELLGPVAVGALFSAGGNPALSAGTTTARVSSSQWKGHLYLLNDEASSLMKIYQDQTSVYQVRNAGLPRFLTLAVWQAPLCIQEMADMANDVHDCMATHFNAVQADTNGHAIYVGGALTDAPDLVANVLLPITPLALDDTLAVTINFVVALSSAYQAHYSDAIRPKELRASHMNLYDHPGVPNVPLTRASDPKTFLECAQVLNEIKRNFNWHVRSFKGHYDPNFNLPKGLEVPLHHVTTNDLADTEEGPVFGDIDFTTTINFANKIKTNFNAHLNDAVISHPIFISFVGTTDTENQIYLPDATDENSLRELAAWIYQAYADHQADIAPVFFLTGTSSLATRTLVKSVVSWPQNTLTPNGQISNIEIGMNLFSVPVAVAPYDGIIFPFGCKVTAVDPVGGILTFDHNNTGVGVDGDYIILALSKTKYHYFNSGGLIPFVSDKGILAPLVDSDGKAANAAIVATDLGLLTTTLLDVADKFNSHDNNFGLVTTTPVAFPHNSRGGHTIVETDIPRTLQNYSYEYAFIWAYEYTTLDGTKFRNASKPYYKLKETLNPIESISSTIAVMPLIDNGTTQNYDVDNLKIEVYRSINNGQALHLVGKVANGEGGFIDNISDNQLASGLELYTDGGVIENDAPPTGKFLHFVDDTFGYIAAPTITNADLTTSTLPNRIQQSVPGDMDSWPGSFFVNLPAPVTGISSAQSSIPVAFTADKTFRLEGAFDLLGRGQIRPVVISNTVGCVSGTSIIQIDTGVVFWGNDGVYFTDGYRISKLSGEWNATYRSLVNSPTKAKNVQGVLDTKFRRVWWGASLASNENNTAYILDLNYGLDEQQGAAFTTASNGDYFAPTALAFFNKQIIRGDSRGYVFKHDFAYTNDPKLDTTGADITGAAWRTRAINWHYQSCASDFGSNERRKWTTRIFARFGATTSLSALITGINDLGKNTGACAAIRYRGASVEIAEKRHFPAGNLRCSHKQIDITLAKVVITNSDALGLAAVTLTNTVTLPAPVPSDMVDHVIAFVADGYVAEFAILSQDATGMILTVAGATNIAATKWVIRGYPKTETFKLLEYGVQFALHGTTQTAAGGESGANA